MMCSASVLCRVFHAQPSLPSPASTPGKSPAHRGRLEAQRRSVAYLRSHSSTVVKLQSHFCPAHKSPRVAARVIDPLVLASDCPAGGPAEERGSGGWGAGLRVPQEQGFGDGPGHTGLLRTLDNQTSSAILRGWIRRDPRGLLVSKYLMLDEPLRGVGELVPRTSCLPPHDGEVTFAQGGNGPWGHLGPRVKPQSWETQR